MTRPARPDQLEHAEHEQHARAGDHDEDQRFFGQHTQSRGPNALGIDDH